MEAHEIHITIDRDGNLAVETKGVQGEGCEALAAVLDELGTVTSKEHTADFYRDKRQRRQQGLTVTARG